MDGYKIKGGAGSAQVRNPGLGRRLNYVAYTVYFLKSQLPGEKEAVLHTGGSKTGSPGAGRPVLHTENAPERGLFAGLGVGDGEAGAAEGEGAGVADGGAAAFEDAAGDGEAEAGAAVLGGEVGGEEFGDVLCGDAGAVILDDDVVEAVAHRFPQRHEDSPGGLAFQRVSAAD